MKGAVAFHAVTDQTSHTRHVILGFVAGGCRLINHNHHVWNCTLVLQSMGSQSWCFLDSWRVSECRHTQTSKIRNRWNCSLWLKPI